MAHRHNFVSSYQGYVCSGCGKPKVGRDLSQESSLDIERMFSQSRPLGAMLFKQHSKKRKR